MAKKKSSHEYVVGYTGKDACVYGRFGNDLGGEHNVHRLTETQAIRVLGWLKDGHLKATLYRLEPVATKTVAEWRKTKSGA